MLKIPIMISSIVSMMLILVSCYKTKDLCNDEIIEEIISPDKKNIVYKFVRDCGATTSESLHVAIRRSNTQIKNNDIGKVLILKRPAKIALRWISENKIEINAYVGRDDIIMVNKKYNNITIQLKQIGAD